MNILNSFDVPAKIITRKDAPKEIKYSLTLKEGIHSWYNRRFSKEALKAFVIENFPQKFDVTAEKVRKIVKDISFLLLVAGLSYILIYYIGYRERIALFNKWQSEIEQIDESVMPEYEIKKLWESIKRMYPDVDFPEGMSLKFANLYAMNQDVVGALHIKEKELWFPLMQSKESRNYYLYRDLYKQYSRYGNPYVHYSCNVSKEGLSKNTIILGHNTHDKLGFNKLTTYMTVDGYKEAPLVTLETLYEKTQWKIFAVMLTNSTSAADRGHLFNYLIADFASNSDFMSMIDGIYQRSMINTGIDVNEDDKILTLYTCYQHIFEGGRLVVFARLLRDGESPQVDVSNASFNYGARYPQAYYDQLNLVNPYEKYTQPIPIE